MRARACWSKRAGTPIWPACLRIRMWCAVNKMDAVDWSHDVYRRIRDQFLSLTSASGFRRHAIPVSALEGDNVVESSRRARTTTVRLLRYLEEIVVERPSDPTAAGCLCNSCCVRAIRRCRTTAPMQAR